MSTIVVFLLGIENLRFGDAEDYLNAAIAIYNFEVYPREASLPFF